MEHRLTQEQIQQLFDFTRQHFVEHYDVQVELVDHLANAIEAQWSENPDISFDDALQTEFKKFGIFGFSSLVEQKQSELYTHYLKMMWKEMVQFVSIPKIILTIGLYFVVFTALKAFFPISEIVLYVLVALGFIYVIASGFWFISRITKRQKKTQKKWLIQTVAGQAYGLLPSIGFSSIYTRHFFFSSDIGSDVPVAYLHI